MDTPTRYTTLPPPPPTRARCPKSLPRLTTSTAPATRSCDDVGVETPGMPPAAVRGSDSGADHVTDFSTFLSAGSTILRVTTAGNHPSPTTAARAFLTETGDGSTPLPVSVWAVKREWASGDERGRSSFFCVYRTHKEACEALCPQTTTLHFNLAPALDADLQPFAKLQLVHAERRLPDSSLSLQSPFSLEMSSPVISLPPPPRFSSLPDLVAPMQYGSGTFVLSSNPPNPKANFRFGDWICPSVSCAVHNFGRNSSCIGCGTSRSAVGSLAVQHTGRMPPQRFSPRFADVESPPREQVDISLIGPVTHLPMHPSQASKNPLQIQLTPSGTQICVGGKVQNISNNPLAPCYMFWSFNEPLPEPGQIRPTLSVALQHPPILNTGNRGPIEHQPGDWICKKCNYLNWRRRKVCQTCYPYAEGNGDSISATVQAERIALLASTIREREFHSLPPSPSSAVHERPLRRPSLPLRTLATAQQQSGDVCRHDGQPSLISRSQSHQANWFLKPRQPSPGTGSPGSENPKTLYQTSFGNGSSPSFTPGSATGPPAYANASPPGPLLPSFLQDIVRSPSLSPASSTDFSLEDYSNDEVEPGLFTKFNETGASIPHRGPGPRLPPVLKSTTSLTSMFNIWKLDGDEKKGW